MNEELRIVTTVRGMVPKVLAKKMPKEIGVVEISRHESQRLNREYRSKNKPANVLSFWYSSDYGEILLCPETIRKDAKAQKHTYAYQMTWMIVHGMIHLTGTHHEKSEQDAQRVERIEKGILSKIL